jgi:hypothetical protein
VGLKLNETYQFLVYADYVNLLGDNIGPIKKNTQTLIAARKEVGLKVNRENYVNVAVSSPESRANLWHRDS